jgi:hypothetical protein
MSSIYPVCTGGQPPSLSSPELCNKVLPMLPV